METTVRYVPVLSLFKRSQYRAGETLAASRNNNDVSTARRSKRNCNIRLPGATVVSSEQPAFPHCGRVNKSEGTPRGKVRAGRKTVSKQIPII